MIGVTWLTVLVCIAQWILSLLNFYVAWVVVILLVWGFAANILDTARTNGIALTATLLSSYAIMGVCAYGACRLLGTLV